MASFWLQKHYGRSGLCGKSIIKHIQSELIIHFISARTNVKDEIENKKVVIPNDKEQIKAILGFLDEEAYKGPFSQNTFLAN